MDSLEKLIEKEFGLHGSPLLVHFNGNIPRVFDGDLADEEEYTKFIMDSLEKSDIEEVNGDVLDSLITRLPNLVAVFFDRDDEKDMDMMTKKQQMSLVWTNFLLFYIGKERSPTCFLELLKILRHFWNGLSIARQVIL